MVVDFPTPGAPVMPTRSAEPFAGRMSCRSRRAAHYYQPLGVGEGRAMCPMLARAWAACLLVVVAAGHGHASDLIWQVENPFRFFKAPRAFALHENGFNAVHANPAAPLPSDVI